MGGGPTPHSRDREEGITERNRGLTDTPPCCPKDASRVTVSVKLGGEQRGEKATGSQWQAATSVNALLSDNIETTILFTFSLDKADGLLCNIITLKASSFQQNLLRDMANAPPLA